LAVVHKIIMVDY